VKTVCSLKHFPIALANYSSLVISLYIAKKNVSYVALLKNKIK